MPCVSKPTCTHVTIILLRLICYIQCRFSISYVSIPGRAAYDRCNISHIFTFSFQLQCRAVPFIYKTIFGRIQNLVASYKELGKFGFIIICFKTGWLNFSPCLWSPFLFVPNNWDLLWLLLVLSLSLFSLLLPRLLFSYTRNQYNYLITYYSFICCLLEEHLLLPY